MGKTPIGRSLVVSLVVSLVLTSDLVLPAPAAAATVPTGFTDTLVASGMPNPTAMAFAPDGRLFVAQQGGALRVIKNGSLLATPFLTVTVSSSGERGLLGVAFDPDFPARPGPGARQPLHHRTGRALRLVTGYFH